ncbi:protein canopy homolog 2-like [Ptychodera flava]|uniref:protein canopy homolog 2-like n=1 Tax=Ptychodera flava TaxID=63121 RepID=UPI003969CB6E
MFGRDYLAVLLLTCLYSHPVVGRRDPELYCGACMALVDEMDYAIKQVDPRRMIEVGSFRVQPDGSQKQTKIPYATSETHLMELLETICDKMNDYAERKDPETQKKTYIRFNNREGESEPKELTNVSISAEVSKVLKFACESILDDHEDDIIHLFMNKQKNIHNKLCGHFSDLCPDLDEVPLRDEL